MLPACEQLKIKYNKYLLEEPVKLCGAVLQILQHELKVHVFELKVHVFEYEMPYEATQYEFKSFATVFNAP